MKEVKNVFKWYFNFSQVGAISQAREEDKRGFRWIWLLGYAIGCSMTLFLVYDLIQVNSLTHTFQGIVFDTDFEAYLT